MNGQVECDRLREGPRTIADQCGPKAAAFWGPAWLEKLSQAEKVPQPEPLEGANPDTPAVPEIAPEPAIDHAAALRAEVEAVERRDFPAGFPPILTRCVGHYLAGPTVPPAEGLPAWWAAARRQVLRMIETVKRDPERWANWRPPEP